MGGDSLTDGVADQYPDGSLAGSLKSLGENMFQNQDQREYARQNALHMRALNQNVDPMVAALRNRDINGMMEYGTRMGMSGSDIAAYQRMMQPAGAAPTGDSLVPSSAPTSY